MINRLSKPLPINFQTNNKSIINWWLIVSARDGFSSFIKFTQWRFEKLISLKISPTWNVKINKYLAIWFSHGDTADGDDDNEYKSCTTLHHAAALPAWFNLIFSKGIINVGD